MSNVIGKKVSFIEVEYSRSSGNKTGIVLDKFSGTVKVRNDFPSGKGGTMTVDNYVSVDYYLIQTDAGLKKIECSHIRSVEP